MLKNNITVIELKSGRGKMEITAFGRAFTPLEVKALANF